ncbi:cupin domain-containing protein [Nocardia sp. CC227C]|uniref:cupin domain-containing protein n=1 Tax=Nocardia sp. CC227C TaxID=3044562 RepID=UPI00278BE806|nr:cupin domain-containing protein [Nocardia sp. CC227C]
MKNNETTATDVQLPTVCAPGEGLRVASGGIVYRFLATSAETNDKYSLFEATLRPGEGSPFHVHSREEEAFFVLDGEVAFYTETERIPARPGTFINASIGVVRGFRNETDRNARMLILVAPSGLEGMFLEDGTILTDPTQEAPRGGTECPVVAGQYGIEVMPYDLPPV